MALSLNNKANKDSMADTVNANITMNDNSPSSSLESSKQGEVLLEAMKLFVDMANAADDCSASGTGDALNDLLVDGNHDSHNSILWELKHAMERLLSTRRAAQQEADAQAQQVQRLELQMKESNRRIQELERAVKRLYKRNQVLQQALQQTKETMAKQHEQDQVLAHERLLKLETNSTRRNVEEEDDESCTSSVSTMASCITDDGIATVCYDSPASLLPSPSLLEASTTRSHSTEEYSLQFPQGTKSGLQFCKLELKQKKGLLNQVILDDNANACITTTTTPTKDSSFRHLPFRSGKQNDDQHECMYVVCGHYGFDCDLNTAPSLGAHLIKVNGEFTRNMTLDKIRAAIQSNKCEFFSLTFRNEGFSKAQQQKLNSAVQVTQRQYQEADEERGGARSECHGAEMDEHQHKNKPVIICMHDENDGPTRFSSFLHGARKRTFSDGAVRTEGVSRGSGAEKAETPSSEQNVVVSPSTRSFYSILHGSSHGKIDEGITVESKHSTRERESSLSDDVNSSGSASRFASIFGIARSRTFSDNNVLSESENSIHNETSNDNPVSPSGRDFYSILHGDANASTSDEVDKTSPTTHTTNGVPGSCSEGDDEEHKDPDVAEETLDSDSRMSSLFNSVRKKAFSEATDELGDPPSNKPETETTGVDVDTPETPRKRLSSFITGAGSRNRVDSDPVDSDDTEETAESGMATSPLPHHPTDESSPTGASGKLHIGIKSMGSRFRSWAPAVGKNT